MKYNIGIFLLILGLILIKKYNEISQVQDYSFVFQLIFLLITFLPWAYIFVLYYNEKLNDEDDFLNFIKFSNTENLNSLGKIAIMLIICLTGYVVTYFIIAFLLSLVTVSFGTNLWPFNL
jgi:hypothetical protein